MIKQIIKIVFMLTLSVNAYAVTYNMNDYTLIWHVAETDSLKYEVIKTPHKRYARITDNIRQYSVNVSSSDAIKVYNLLKQSDKIFSARKKGKKLNETIAAGDVTLVFVASTKYGRSIVISGEGLLSTVFLQPKDIPMASDWFKQTPAMIEKLNKSFKLKLK